MPRLWHGLTALRTQRPVVHNVTNPVAISLSAGVLQAIGARPVMAQAPEELEEIVRGAAAVTVNIGMPTADRAEAMRLAAGMARREGRPWVLDPVGVGGSAYRRSLARDLIDERPVVIRGNADEILVLAGIDRPVGGIGIDAETSADAALPAARALARRTGAIVAVTGAVDHVTDGVQFCAISNGHPMMTRVSGLGCALTCLVGAALAVEADPVAATVLALGLLGIAGEIAAARVTGPGSLPAAIIDALYALDRPTLERKARTR